MKLQHEKELAKLNETVRKLKTSKVRDLTEMKRVRTIVKQNVKGKPAVYVPVSTETRRESKY